MPKNSNIPIRNIYHMLSYAYQTLSFAEYQKIGTEDFENIFDLYAEILSIGIPVLIRGGLIRDYVGIDEKSTVIRGKIDINSSIKQNSLVNKKLVVLYDEFSEDIILNQIIKATIVFMSHTTKVDPQKRRFFHALLPYFGEVSDMELGLNIWKKLRYNRQNIRYQFIIDICRYLYETLLFDENSNDQFTKRLNDEQRLSSLFEKFVFSFYKRESLYNATHPQIPWNVDDEFTEALPVMQTDIVLKSGNKFLIIDTKFYSESMNIKFEGGKAKQISHNLYQIFTYVNNWKNEPNEVIGGMLLYAGTRAENQPCHAYNINGNKIYVQSLNMNQNFSGIKSDLIAYAQQYFD